jgi:hypothetical protein
MTGMTGILPLAEGCFDSAKTDEMDFVGVHNHILLTVFSLETAVGVFTMSDGVTLL